MATNLAVMQPSESPKEKKGRGGQEAIDRLATPELVIALCGPLGSPLHEVASVFSKQLQHEYDYKSIRIIRLSDIIRELSDLPADTSIKKLIESGNQLRADRGNEILAAAAIEKISAARETLSEPQASEQPPLFPNDNLDNTHTVHPTPIERHCHIIDSIKNVDELRLLRSVYGDMLHVVGVYTPIELRIAKLSARTHEDQSIYELIDRDSGEEFDNGQSVAKTFPQADFFLRADRGTDSELTAPVSRFLNIMLGAKIMTPTALERAMYAAYSAARNSACLSRQVGAAITSADDQIIAVGWNDVPRPFGGLYEFSGDGGAADHRCWNKNGGKCFNDEEKDTITAAVVDILLKKGVLQQDKALEARQLIRDDSRLKNLIEFSRAVHAEMHALLNAGATNGQKIAGGKLFVTTYPCHSCARHIIASGIREVYFLEPYRKSLATKLHSDAITEVERDMQKVRLMPFHGVAPSRFLQFFSAPDKGRKDKEGRMRVFPQQPVTAKSMEAVRTLEGLAIKRLHP